MITEVPLVLASPYYVSVDGQVKLAAYFFCTLRTKISHSILHVTFILLEISCLENMRNMRETKGLKCRPGNPLDVSFSLIRFVIPCAFCTCRSFCKFPVQPGANEACARINFLLSGTCSTSTFFFLNTSHYVLSRTLTDLRTPKQKPDPLL